VKPTPRRSALLLSLLCASLPAFCAESGDDGIRIELRGRMGVAATSPDHLQRHQLTFGFGLSFPTMLPGRVGVEVGYSYKPGSYYLNSIGDPPSTIRWVDPVTKIESQVAPNAIDRVNAASDARINYLDGAMLRAWYTDGLPWLGSDWEWHAGLQLGGTNFKHEVQGDIRSQNWGVTGTTPKAGSWRDAYWSYETKKYIGISPYAGISCSLAKNTRFELNLMILNYRNQDYVHATGTGVYSLKYYDQAGVAKPYGMLAEPNGFAADHIDSKLRFVPHLEVGFAYQF